MSVPRPACVIGVDFDNTIAGYDDLMHDIALERGLIQRNFPRNKRLIRDAIRRLDDGETRWRGVQVTAYGQRMHEAQPLAGAKAFFAECRRRGIPTYIVSHKTEYLNFGEATVNLRALALEWLDRHGFLTPTESGIERSAVFFESTRTEKLDRIRTLGATHFIDDLEETFSDGGFPSHVQGMLLASSDDDGATDLPAVRFATWNEIHQHLFDSIDRSTVAALARQPVLALIKTGAGGNNRIYRALCDGGSEYAAKVYLQPSVEGRDRLEVEFGSLSFLWEHGLRQVPRPVAFDAANRIGLYEYIAGAPIQSCDVEESDIEQLADFAKRLKELADGGAVEALLPASEACFAFSALHRNLLARFGGVSAAEGEGESYLALRSFLSQELGPAIESVSARVRQRRGDAAWSTEIPLSSRTLSPSDMGFHNALRREDGSIALLDFEYFGVDDPVKLLADVLLHPAMELSDTLKQSFARRMHSAFRADGDFAVRFGLMYPMFGLKWCLILLNEFVPAFIERREFAEATARPDREHVRARQLDKSRRMLARTMAELDRPRYSCEVE